MSDKPKRVNLNEQRFVRDQRRFLLMAKISMFLVFILALSVLVIKAWTWRAEKEVPTFVGPAAVTECIHHSDIGWMGVPGEGIPSMTLQEESWELWLRIGEQADSVRVSRTICRLPPGSLLQVRYRNLPRTGRLVIYGIVDPSL